MRINKLWLLVSLILILCSLPLYAQNTDNYMEQGGARWVVGGELDVTGSLKIDGTALTPTAAEINKLHGMTASKEDLNTLTGVAAQFICYQVEDLAADGDIAARSLFVCPTGFKFTLSSVAIISQGSAAGIADGHTCAIAVLNGTDSIVSKTYKTDPAFPADGTADDLGALNDTHKVLDADDVLKFSVTNGTNANPPAFILQIVGTLETVSE